MNQENELKKSKKVRIFKIVLSVIFAIICIAIIAYLMPIMKDIATDEGRIAFKQKIESAGFMGWLMLFGLQFAQIFLVVLPGEPLEVLAGMCYGTIGGTAFILGSVFIITVLIYFLVSRYKKNFLYEFFSKEKIDKIENSVLFKNPKKAQILFTILFLIPGTPKDLLTYIGALFPIKPWKFILISVFARFPSVISSTIAGAHLAEGNWQATIITYVITFAITAIAVFIINFFDKEKSTKDALATIK